MVLFLILSIIIFLFPHFQLIKNIIESSLLILEISLIPFCFYIQIPFSRFFDDGLSTFTYNYGKYSHPHNNTI